MKDEIIPWPRILGAWADSLARERKTMASYQKLSRPGAPGKSRNSSGEDPCKVPAQVRVTQFPNQSFYAYQNNLHCRVCKVQVMKKKSNVNDHTLGVNHIKSLKKDAISKVQTNGILDYITANKPALGFGSMTPIKTIDQLLLYPWGWWIPSSNYL
jgi:hypothetical protein